MTKKIPCSSDAYIQDIRKVLPPGCISSEIAKLEIFSVKKAYPAKSESLSSWIDNANRNSQGKLPVTLILGESSSDYRKTRAGLLLNQSQIRPLNMAHTCDGAAGAQAIIGMLRKSHVNLEDLDFNAIIDEWNSKYPDLCQCVKNSHLIVIGTPEVNIFATLLHGLVKDFHFGQEEWPPDLYSAGDILFAQNVEYRRCPRGHEVSDCGAVFLIRNPWNPSYRVLWIGGLTGIGTWRGTEMVASGWSDYHDMASISTGVVFGRNIPSKDKKIKPQNWLIWNNNEPSWQSSLKIQLINRPKSKLKKYIFLSYCHDNESEVNMLRKDLIDAGEKVWWDKDIKPGQDWRLEIRNAVKNSYAYVLCLSQESQLRTTAGIYPEALDAISVFREYTPGSIFVIPVRLSNCEIPSIQIDSFRTLDSIEYVDLFPENKRADELERLINSIQSAPNHP